MSGATLPSVNGLLENAFSADKGMLYLTYRMRKASSMDEEQIFPFK